MIETVSTRYSKAVAFSLAAALLGIGVGCAGGGSKAGGSNSRGQVLTLVTSGGTGVTTDIRDWADAVRRRSHDRLRIADRSWRQDDPHFELHMLRALRAGRFDLAVVGARVFDRLGVRSFQPLLAPLLVDSYPLEQRIFSDPVAAHMLAGVARAGVVGIGLFPAPLKRLFGPRRPFRRRGDFRGGTVGYIDSALAAESLRALGARPQPITAKGTLTGLDGIEAQVSYIAGHRWTRGYVAANVNLWPRAWVIVAGKQAFRRLSAKDQALLPATARAMVPTAMRVAAVDDVGGAAPEMLCQKKTHVVAASSEDLASLRVAVRPIYDSLARDPSTRSAFTRIVALKRTVAAPPSGVPSCAKAYIPPGAATRVDGTYALTTKAADLPSAQRIPENYGAWQLVLDRGRFRLSQASDGADWVADGTDRVAGARVTFVFGHVYNMGPHGVPDGLPVNSFERVAFAWRRSGSELVLRPADRATPLPALAVRPLERVEPAPSAQPLANTAALEGEWETIITRKRWLSTWQGRAEPDGFYVNGGRYTFSLKGTHCRWSQVTPRGEKDGAAGICRFAGDTIEIPVSGATMFMRWSVYRGVLSFRPAAGFTFDFWAVAPWHRIAK